MFLISFPALAQEDDFLADTTINAPQTEESKEFNYEPKPLDGVLIEALETYKNPKSNEVAFGLGLYPFDPFFNGFAFGLGYTHYFNKEFAWEVVQGQYVYAVQGDLSSQLAETYAVNPDQLETMDFAGSTNLHYIHSYGKLVFMEDYIEYFRSGVLGGVGFVNTNERFMVALSLGAKVEFFVNDTFSWKVEVRDLMTFDGGVENFVSFNIGTGINF